MNRDLVDIAARKGPIERRERRLAFVMLSPTVLAVLAIVAFPLLANFWISVKPVALADLRSARILVRERINAMELAAMPAFEIEYRVRSTSSRQEIRDAWIEDFVPDGFDVIDIDPLCAFEAGSMRLLRCDLGDIAPRQSLRLKVTLVAVMDGAALPALQSSAPQSGGDSVNVLTSLDFTLQNFIDVFDARDFWTVLWVTFVYTVLGTLGALLLGLFAAQMLVQPFFGRTIFRGLFLFPYVAPVIAMAFTWVFLLDPFSGTVNALIVKLGMVGEPVNFLGQRGIALVTVIAFESWRYFPLAFLFILARMQSIPSDIGEAAKMDGASPLQSFRYIALPQLVGILSTLFVLRFIWTFNKFDDIFLLTGGASGTRTLTVNVYEQAFALSNLGAGAAVAVIIFSMLALFLALYFHFAPREEGF